MKISSQEEYGLRCLMQVARRTGDQPVPISEIAGQEGLSVEYVGKLLMKLRRGGLVGSVRGKAGGYVLARATDEITLKDVLDVLAEPIYDRAYCERFKGTESECVHLNNCGIRPVWTTVNRFLSSALGAVTVEDLVKGEGAALSRLHDSIRDQASKLPRKRPSLDHLPVVG